MIVNAIEYLGEYKVESVTYQKKVSASLDKMRSNTDSLYNLLREGPGILYKKPSSLSFCTNSGKAFIPESAQGVPDGWSITTSDGHLAVGAIW